VSPTAATWQLRRLQDRLCVLRLDPGKPVPEWVWQATELVSVTRTTDELSVVCPEELAREVDDVAGPYVAFAVDAQLDFLLTGVLSGLLDPMTEEGISTLAMSTYLTDWILVPAEQVDEAIAAWRRRGHTVV
jgi:hypothetical protein